MAIRQVADMHLDERLEKSREALSKNIAVGQKKVSSAFNNLWAEMEAMREAQRKRQEEHKLAKESEPTSPTAAGPGGRCKFSYRIIYFHYPALTHSQPSKRQTSPTPRQTSKQHQRAQAPTSPPGVPGHPRRRKAGASRKVPTPPL